MFIQVVQGRCTRRDELRTAMQETMQEMAPGEGFLGGTYGFTDDNELVAVTRFSDREAAMASSARPEAEAASQRMMTLMDGPVRFHNCDDVTIFLDGGSDRAGFVQIIQGRIDDPRRLKAMLADARLLHQLRPEMIGGTLAVEEDGTFTQTVAFTDEDAARRDEKVTPPPDVQDELTSALRGATYYDLHEPWFM